ncbi:MAG: O-antigen ligase family protein [Crocinitomicaceae bacterium]|nr:O-antigen ligase family protein [Crocinitomicaceae bacterium]
MNKLIGFANREKVNEILFVLLIISFPFGSYLPSFSVGFMTVYPYLIFLGALTFFSLLRKFFPQHKLEKYYLLFVLFFFLVAICFLPFVNGKSDAIIDIRSIGLMLATSYVFISIKSILGFERWKSILVFCFKVVFFLIVAFCLFELVSGIHFSGKYTEHVIARGLADQFLYTPVFLWDNPNNLLVYLILIGVVIILLDSANRQRETFSLLILFICFFLAYLVKARMGMLICSMLILGYVALVVGMKFRKHFVPNRSRLMVIGISVLCLAYVYVFTDKFFGIPNENLLVIKTAPAYPELVDGDRVTEDDIWYSAENNQVQNDTSIQRNSNTERTALIKNGLDFIMDSRLMGIGPGQYRYLHDSGKVNHYAFGNSGPHFWLIELFSQFGILIFLPYVLLFCWMILIALRSFRSDPYTSVLLLGAIMTLILASILPSAFLILDINWIFTVVLILTASELSVKKLVAKHD